MSTGEALIGQRGLQKGDWLICEFCHGFGLITLSTDTLDPRIKWDETDNKVFLPFIKGVNDFIHLAKFVAGIHGFKHSGLKQIAPNWFKIQMT